eukprot:g17313.t1
MAETTEKTKKLEKTKVLKPLEEVIDLGTEEVPLHSAQERLELRRTDDKSDGFLPRVRLKQLQRADRDAAFLLAKAEVLQTAEPGFIEQEEDNAILLTQQEIIDSAGVGVARKHFDFELPYGPYN